MSCRTLPVALVFDNLASGLPSMYNDFTVDMSLLSSVERNFMSFQPVEQGVLLTCVFGCSWPSEGFFF